MEKNVRKIVILLFVILVLLFNYSVYAQEEDKVNPGITPDSPFYGLDVALDKINLAFENDPTKKSEKGIGIARERLIEIKVMLEENKLDAAVKAKDFHKDSLDVIKQSVKEIEIEDSLEELESEIEIEKNLQEHKEEIELIEGEINIKLKIKGELTENQQAMIDSIIDNLDENVREVKIEIDNKKGETKIRIKQEKRLSDEEIEDEEDKLEIEHGLNKIKVRAEIIDDNAVAKIKNKFITSNTSPDGIIDEIIESFSLDLEEADMLLKIENENESDDELEEKFKVKVKIKEDESKVKVELKYILNSTDRDSILNSIVDRSQLTRDEILLALEYDRNNNELEVEVEIEDGTAEIKVEYLGEELEFEMNTTDLDEIINEIIARTGLTREQIESVMKVEIEDEEMDEDDDERDEEDDEENSTKTRINDTSGKCAYTGYECESSSNNSKVCVQRTEVKSCDTSDPDKSYPFEYKSLNECNADCE